MISDKQIRAARGLLGWSQGDLARAAGVGIATVKRFEGAEGKARGAIDTILRIQQAFEEHGVRFFGKDETGGEGLRLNK